jgi:ArsR family metal-binding transcriptional regulator
MAFAFSLLFGEHALADCPPLTEPEHAEGGLRLAEMIG